MKSFLIAFALVPSTFMVASSHDEPEFHSRATTDQNVCVRTESNGTVVMRCVRVYDDGNGNVTL